MNATIKVTVKKIQVQGLDCYIPVLKVYESDKLIYSFAPQGDPLVTRATALKYGHLHARDLKSTNLFNGKEFINII